MNVICSLNHIDIIYYHFRMYLINIELAHSKSFEQTTKIMYLGHQFLVCNFTFCHKKVEKLRVEKAEHPNELFVL